MSCTVLHTDESTRRVFADNVSRALNEAGFPQRWLAQQIGVNEMLVSRMLRRIVPIRAYNALNISTVLRLSIDQLFDPNLSYDEIVEACRTRRRNALEEKITPPKPMGRKG